MHTHTHHTHTVAALQHWTRRTQCSQRSAAVPFRCALVLSVHLFVLASTRVRSFGLLQAHGGAEPDGP